MGPGFNKRGGAATVTDKRTDVDGVMTYTVAYTVEGGSEKDLPASLLSARTDVRERREGTSTIKLIILECRLSFF